MDGLIVRLSWHGIVILIFIIIFVVMHLKERREKKQLIKLYEKEKQNSILDPLTHIYNRRELDRRLNEEIGRASRYKHKLAVMFIDLDRFKIINDTLSHEFGDKVLKKVAETIKECTRQIDFVARHGGDEFVVILPETSLDSAQFVGKKLIEAIEAIAIEKSTFTLSASIGIYQFDPDNPTLDLIKIADEAMYEAKNGGKGKVFISHKSLKFLAT